MKYSGRIKFNPSPTFSLSFCLGFKTLSVLTPEQSTHQKSATTVRIYTVCLSETWGTCPSPVLSSSQQALFKCHRDVSHVYRLYVDCGPKLCSEVSSLITVSSLVWSAVTKAPFTGTACLLSSINLEFHCSGREAPEALRLLWGQWRNMALPSLAAPPYSMAPVTESRCFAQSTETQFPGKMTLRQQRTSLEFFYFISRYLRCINGKVIS